MSLLSPYKRRADHLSVAAAQIIRAAMPLPNIVLQQCAHNRFPFKIDLTCIRRGTTRLNKRFAEMPRYFFHLHNDVEARDEDGVELADLEAARLLALDNVRFTAGETIKDTGRIVLDHRIDIEDENGNVLDTVRFGDAVTVDD